MMLTAALALLALAVVTSWFSTPRTVLRPQLSWLMCCAAAVILVIAGARGMADHLGRVPLGGLGGLGPANLQVDRLSGMFLVIAFGVAVPVLLAGAVRGAARRRRLPALVAVTLAAVAVIIAADNFFVLLFGWESLTFAFYLLTGFDRARPHRPASAVVTGVFGKASGSALLVGGALLAGNSGTFTIAAFGQGRGGPVAQAGYALLLLGFAIKVGLVPVQIWLPPGYAHASPAARAVMAGVAVNVGYYGMWRTMQVLGPPPTWLTVLTLVLGGGTAILGAAHSAVHAELPHLIAWSSVENAGVITAGYGVAMMGAQTGQRDLVAAGLLAATAQVCAHALGKSLLFVSAASVDEHFDTSDLDQLRGLARRLPFTGAGLVVGAWTLAGLPLAAGFASEWLTLQALMQQFRVSGLALHLAAAVAGALVALSIGVAGLTFVRLIGLTALGPTTSRLRPPQIGTSERSVAFRAAVALLATGCLGLAMVAPLEVRVIARGLTPLVGAAAASGRAGPWVIQPVYADFSALSPSWLWIIIPGLVVLIGAVGMLLGGGRMFRVRRVPAWASASPGVERGAGYTSYAFANPIRKVLANLLLTRGELRSAARRTEGAPGTDSAPDSDSGTGAAGGVGTDEAGADSGAGTDSGTGAADRAAAAGVHLGYTVDVADVVQRYGYRPTAAVVLRLARLTTRLQSGRLDAYLAYMLIALVAVLALVTALA